MGGRLFEGFNILFLAARRERRADTSSGTTSPLWQSGTHISASPFAVSAVGDVTWEFDSASPTPWDTAKDTVG